jgi:hypothetical protein
MVGARPALGKPFLGLQQPVHYQQLAHQVIQGLAGGPPARITQRPGEERVGLLLLLGEASALGLPSSAPALTHPAPLPGRG